MTNILKTINKKSKIIASLALMIIVGLGLLYGFYDTFQESRETQTLAEESKVFEKYNIAENQAVIFLDSDQTIINYTGDKTIFGYKDGELVGKKFIELFNCTNRKPDEPIISCPIRRKNGDTALVVKRLTKFVNADVAGVDAVIMFQRKRPD